VVSGDKLARLGDGGYDLGARASQIRDGLLALDKAKPEDMLAIQLDDRALFLARWRELLLRTLNDQAVAGDPRLQELRRLVEQTWTGHASVDSVAYRAARGFRSFTRERAFTPLTAACEKADPLFALLLNQTEGPLWALVSQRPMHLLDPQYESWDALLLAAVGDMLAAWKESSQSDDLAPRTWGERNTTRIDHPLASAIPMAGRWLNVPSRQLPGDQDMPRVQGAGFGASERLVVSPGQEEKGFFHMPVGQSGHPMSPYYRAGHEAWEEGRPTPFLPGKTEHTLRLVPAG
jgi:penicillin amidase